LPGSHASGASENAMQFAAAAAAASVIGMAMPV